MVRSLGLKILLFRGNVTQVDTGRVAVAQLSIIMISCALTA